MKVSIAATPLRDGPFISAGSGGEQTPGLQNINGPSLIRRPPWVSEALGEFYLYFADHKGVDIKRAHADVLEGPWSIYEPGVLNLRDTPFLHEPPSVPASVDPNEISSPRAMRRFWSTLWRANRESRSLVSKSPNNETNETGMGLEVTDRFRSAP